MNQLKLLQEELCKFSWASARAVLLSNLIMGLIRLNSVNLRKIANQFVGEAQVDSNYKRLQRFFRHYVLEMDGIAKLIGSWLGIEKWVLCLDRTNWQIGQSNVNILVLAVAYKNTAIPLLWRFLDKKGNSNTQERIDLMKRFLKLFGKEKIAYLTADREFKGKEWIGFLLEEKIPFRIRIPNNTKVSNCHHTQFVTVTRLFPIRNQESMLLNKPRLIWGHKLYLGATRHAGEHVIIISNSKAPLLSDYARRWEIETLFGCLKSRGFDLEQSRLRDPVRLEKLFAILTLTFAWCLYVGQWLHQSKPIRRLNHTRPTYSLFRYGLDFLARLFLSIYQPLQSDTSVPSISNIYFSYDQKN